MKEQYPFFRSEDEHTLAVIGEEAAASDLDGIYQKPYAVLTEKYLYCKNEGGNFITEASGLRSARKTHLRGQNWFLWGAVAFVSISLALLCLWYWGMSGKWFLAEEQHSAEAITNQYNDLKEKVPEYKKTISDYEKAQEDIEAERQRIASLRSEPEYIQNKDSVTKLMNEYQKKRDKLLKAIETVEAELREQESTIKTYEEQITYFQKEIEENEKKLAAVDLEKNTQIKNRIQYLRDAIQTYTKEINNARANNYPLMKWNIGDKSVSRNEYINWYENEITACRESLSQLQGQYVDVESLQITIESLNARYGQLSRYLEDEKEKLNPIQQRLQAAQSELSEYTLESKKQQEEIDSIQDKINRVDWEIEEIEIDISQKQSFLEATPLDRLQSELQRFETLKESSNIAQATLRRVKLFHFFFITFFIALLALFLFTLTGRDKIAAIIIVISSALAFLCVLAVGEHINFGMRCSIFILLALAVVFTPLLLWWSHKRIVYQISHATGTFNFTPSLYPVDEFKNFTAQVEKLKSEAVANA